VSSELFVIAKHITNLLTTDTATHAICADRIYAGAAPQKAVFPCVVFRTMSGLDSTGGNATRIVTSVVVLIEAIGSVSFEAIDALAERIDELFKAASPQILTDGSIISSYREQPWETNDEDNKVTYYRRGGMYRFLTHTT
jgi:hypothetical protein